MMSNKDQEGSVRGYQQPTIAPSNSQGDRPTKVAKTQRLTWSKLAKDKRELLLNLCYEIYRSRSSTLSRAEFEQYFFSHPGLRLALFYNTEGQVCGFSNASLLPIDNGHKTHYVFSAGVYFVPGYRGGQTASLFGLSETLRQKLRAPHRRLAYVPMASNPAPYHLIARYALRYWPRPETEPPPGIETLLRGVIQARGLTPVVGDSWRVKTFVKPDNVERVRQSRHLQNKQSVKFFEKRNPSWDDEHSATALLMWVPLDSLNIVMAIMRIVSQKIIGRRFS